MRITPWQNNLKFSVVGCFAVVFACLIVGINQPVTEQVEYIVTLNCLRKISDLIVP